MSFNAYETWTRNGVALNTFYLLFLEPGQRPEVLPSIHCIYCSWRLGKDQRCCPQYILFIVLGGWAKNRGVALNTFCLLFLEAGQRTEVLPSIHFIYCSWNLKMLLWSICTQERDVMSDKLESVGGYPMISPTFDSSCTHMILSKFIRITQQVTLSLCL